jgi:hypothetical protein
MANKDGCNIPTTHSDKQLKLKRTGREVKSAAQWNRQGWQKTIGVWEKEGTIVVKVWFWATPWEPNHWKH